MPPVKKFDPVLQYRFEIMVPEYLPKTLCKSVTLPKIANNEFKFNYGGGYISAKGTTVWEDVDVEIYADLKTEASAAVKTWLELHRTINGTGGEEKYKDNYSQLVVIDVQGPTGTYVTKYKLFNAYILNADFGQMDWSSSEPNIIKLTLRYDWAEIIINPEITPLPPRPIAPPGGIKSSAPRTISIPGPR